MQKQYTREELWKLYDKLPQELKEAVFSNETAEHNWGACERNQVSTDKVSLVASQVGNVLMGLVLPKDFQSVLQKEVGLKPAVAQAVAQEISRFVFYPVKAQLEQIHQTPGETPQEQKVKDLGVPIPRHSDRTRIAKKPAAPSDYVVQEEEQNEKGQEINEVFTEEQGEPKKDTYREPIE